MTKQKTTIGKNTEELTIWGIVQGVGFRPFVTKLADKMSMKGSVKNMGGFVEIFVTDTKERIGDFINAINGEKPDASEIVRIERKKVDYRDFSGFTIEESSVMDDEIGMIPADMSLCDDCLEEFYDPDNPRFQHPFISCTVCGPRYTIIDSLPYDRVNTTMSKFPMCDFCSDQYNDRNSRRYHSQTISCHDCGPMPEYISRRDEKNIIVAANDDNPAKAVNAAINDITRGRIIALKGTGGYYFVSDPFDREAVKNLREIKVREEKPFAIMFKDIKSIKDYCLVNEEEEKLLKSKARPIVLLERKHSGSGDQYSKQRESSVPQIAENVCESSRYIGAFLPSMGLQYQLIDKTRPLIMTSANLSDLPIIYRDDEILNLLDIQPKLAGVLLNRRDIRMSLDDSVVRVIDNNPQITRKSKGYVPIPLYVDGPTKLTKSDMIYASGSHLKSTFSISKENYSYTSQYFGDLDTIESRKIYENNYHRMKQFFGIEPKLVISDIHPLYHTTQYAAQYAKDHDIELLKVQHHHAHTASVMGENGLTGPVIGVSFDGTGYGTDGNIWGGEFLICEKDSFKRFSHLKYVDIIGGDSSMKEGWKSALSHRFAYEEENGFRSKNDGDCTIDISGIIEYSIKENTLEQFHDISTVKAALKNKINTVKTSSMGRFFDGVSSLLGIHHINRYEGECAINLENAAYFAIGSPNQNEAWDLALKFHEDVARLILSECLKARSEYNIDKVALSGGVFQNKILMEKSLKILRENGFQPYYNKKVPPNDGGISFGQNVIGMYHLDKMK